MYYCYILLACQTIGNISHGILPCIYVNLIVMQARFAIVGPCLLVQ
uniref:Uncharacterized protein n=1 Tax=Setaria italica TaxID=4555 RepID=K4ANZ8_SETIT